VELVAMSDIAEAGMLRHRERFGIEGMYADWTEMLAKEDLDAVSVCTPNRLHEQPTIDALNAGCHVLCEKPLAHSAAAGERMLQTANDTGQKLVIGFQYRYHPRTQFLRRAFDGGQFGTSCSAGSRRCAAAASPTGGSSAARICKAADRSSTSACTSWR